MYRTATAIRRLCGRVAAAATGSDAHAHHAFATEFDANLTGEVKGEVTRVWWQNPHIRYDVAMKMPDGTTRKLGAAAARQSADVSARELDRADDPSRLPGHGRPATSGRDNTKKLYATCINVGIGAREGPRSSAAARTPAPSRRRRPIRTSTTP